MREKLSFFKHCEINQLFLPVRFLREIKYYNSLTLKVFNCEIFLLAFVPVNLFFFSQCTILVLKKNFLLSLALTKVLVKILFGLEVRTVVKKGPADCSNVFFYFLLFFHFPVQCQGCLF